MKIVGQSDQLRGAAIGYPGQKMPNEDGLQFGQPSIYMAFCSVSLQLNPKLNVNNGESYVSGS